MRKGLGHRGSSGGGPEALRAVPRTKHGSLIGVMVSPGPSRWGKDIRGRALPSIVQVSGLHLPPLLP